MSDNNRVLFGIVYRTFIYCEWRLAWNISLGCRCVIMELTIYTIKKILAIIILVGIITFGAYEINTDIYLSTLSQLPEAYCLYNTTAPYECFMYNQTYICALTSTHFIFTTFVHLNTCNQIVNCSSKTRSCTLNITP